MRLRPQQNQFTCVTENLTEEQSTKTIDSCYKEQITDGRDKKIKKITHEERKKMKRIIFTNKNLYWT